MAEWTAVLERRLMEPLGRLAQNVYLQSIRDAFVIFALPVILTGSIFLIVANPPASVQWGPIQAWARAVEPYQAEILFPFHLTFGLVSLVVAFGVGYSLGERREVDSVLAGILSMLAFLMTAFPVEDLSAVRFGDVLDNLVLQLLEKETLNKEQIAEIFKPIVKRPARPAWTGSSRRTPSTRPPVLSPRELALTNGAATANGSAVIVWTCHGGANQRWVRA